MPRSLTRQNEADVIAFVFTLTVTGLRHLRCKRKRQSARMQFEESQKEKRATARCQPYKFGRGILEVSRQLALGP